MRADVIRIPLDQNQDLKAARQTLVKAQAGLAAAKDAYIPDVTALSRYSYQSGVPLLVHYFGTFGVSLSYDLFEGGRREAKVREARSEMHSAEVAVAKMQSEIEVQVAFTTESTNSGRWLMLSGRLQRFDQKRLGLPIDSLSKLRRSVPLAVQSHADLSSATGSLLEARDRPDATIKRLSCMRRFLHESRYELYG
jgi:Outer membrane efflux protein